MLQRPSYFVVAHRAESHKYRVTGWWFAVATFNQCLRSVVFRCGSTAASRCQCTLTRLLLAVLRPCVSFAVFTDHWRRRHWPSRGQSSADPHRLLQLSPVWFTVITTQQTSSSHQRRGSSHPLGTSMRPYHSAARAASLVACPWEDWIQALRAGISLPTWYGSWLPFQQVPPCPMLWLGDICVRRQHHNWSYPPPAVQHLAIGHSLLPLHALGTLFRTLHRLCLLLADFYKHT